MTADGKAKRSMREEFLEAGRRKLEEFRRNKVAAKGPAAQIQQQKQSANLPDLQQASDAGHLSNGQSNRPDVSPAASQGTDCSIHDRQPRCASPFQAATFGIASGYAQLSDSYQSDNDAKEGVAENGSTGPPSLSLNGTQDQQPTSHVGAPSTSTAPAGSQIAAAVGPTAVSYSDRAVHTEMAADWTDLPISFNLQNTSSDSGKMALEPTQLYSYPLEPQRGAVLPISFVPPNSSFDSQGSQYSKLSSENIWDPLQGVGRTTPSIQGRKSPVPQLDLSKLNPKRTNTGAQGMPVLSGVLRGANQHMGPQASMMNGSVVVFPTNQVTTALPSQETSGPLEDDVVARVSSDTTLSAVSPQTVEIISTPRGSTTEAGTDLLSEHLGSSNLPRETFSLPMSGNVQNFTTLQQHIDELTQEKFELQRGMDTQGKLMQSLAEENQVLAEQFNKQGQVVEQLRKKVEQYEAELQAHGLALETVANERDKCQTGVQEMEERVKVLANEDVALEERIRELRVKEIRLTKQLDDARAECESMHWQVEALKQQKNEQMAEAAPKMGTENTLPVPTSDLKSLSEQQGSESHTEKYDAGIQTDYPRLDATPTASTSSKESECSPNTEEGSSSVILDVVPFDLLDALSGEVSGLGMEEKRVIGAIGQLLDGLEEQRRAMVARLHASKVEIANLKAAKRDLSRKLESQTQRLELSLRSNGCIPQEDGRPENLPAVIPGPSDALVLRHQEARTGWFGWLFGGPQRPTRSALM